jgi:uncharacterized membrane protein YcaP (DUF421 family)
MASTPSASATDLLSSTVARVDPKATVTTSEPTLIVHEGRFLEQALVGQRVTKDEVLLALRSSGAGDLADVDPMPGLPTVVSASRP